MPKKEKLTAAGVPYTGHAPTDEVLDMCPDILECIRALRAGEMKTYPLEEVLTRQRVKRGLPAEPDLTAELMPPPDDLR